MSAGAPCMIDGAGRTVADWLAHMQSEDFLRASIRRGVRTADCWSELSRREQRKRAVRSILAAGAASR